MQPGLSLIIGLATLAASPLPNLAFQTGRLTHWHGDGFYLTPARGSGPSRSFAVCSSDSGKRGRTALLYRTFTVPAGAGVVRFSAATFRPSNCEANADLDVILEAAGRDYLPRQVRTANGWRTSTNLRGPGSDGRPCEYQWDVAGYVGQPVRIAIVDRDVRPGCFVFCSGFRILPREDSDAKEFSAAMLKLTKEQHLGPMERYDSKHFMAVTNASDEFTEERLSNCETIYPLFFEHFRSKGFNIREPAGKLMVAVFDTEEGFEAYLGTRMPTAVTGIYHRGSNRLVVYDYASNRALKAMKRAGQQEASKIVGGLTRQRVLGSVNRQAREHREDANVGTIMHEVSHQLSFNCGLLNRDGDMPVWLAEGLATYCESTANGAWQGIGEPNPVRITALVAPAQGRSPFLPLRELIASDAWIQRATSTEQVLLGYGQSWALFRMLMEERPKALRKYLSTIYARRTPEHRLADFLEAIGDLPAFETHYQAYIRQMVTEQPRLAR
jgi:hypothetical protein